MANFFTKIFKGIKKVGPKIAAAIGFATGNPLLIAGGLLGSGGGGGGDKIDQGVEQVGNLGKGTKKGVVNAAADLGLLSTNIAKKKKKRPSFTQAKKDALTDEDFLMS